MTRGTVITVVYSATERVTCSRLSLVVWLLGFASSISTSLLYTRHLSHFNMDPLQ